MMFAMVIKQSQIGPLVPAYRTIGGQGFVLLGQGWLLWSEAFKISQLLGNFCFG